MGDDLPDVGGELLVCSIALAAAVGFSGVEVFGEDLSVVAGAVGVVMERTFGFGGAWDAAGTPIDRTLAVAGVVMLES